MCKNTIFKIHKNCPKFLIKPRTTCYLQIKTIIVTYHKLKCYYSVQLLLILGDLKITLNLIFGHAMFLYLECFLHNIMDYVTL